MLRTNSYSESEPNQPDDQQPSSEKLLIQDKLGKLEEFMENSHNLPLTPYKFVNEKQFFHQMDQLWNNLDAAFEQAHYILQEKESILQQAYSERDHLLQQAQQEATEIKDQTRIVQQARQEASEIHAQTQQECEQLHQQTLEEIEKLRQQTNAECEQLRKDADDYAASVLMNLEQRLTQMLQVTRNGQSSLNSSEQQQQQSSQNKQKPKRKAS